MQALNSSAPFQFSKIIHGYWRLQEWNLRPKEILSLMQFGIDKGIYTIDHADIYGNYSCESLFGEALALQPSLRKEMQLVSKCGIKLLSNQFPERVLKHYDYSKKYIIQSVENSLANLHTDYLDVLLLHRPSPFFNPEEVAEAFSILHQSGKVIHFGVSNFTPNQMQLLQSFWGNPLVTNQVEISPYCLDYFQNGTVEYLLQHGIQPMAWSPLAGGKLFHGTDDKAIRVQNVLREVGEEINESQLEKISYAWLFKHPSQIHPIIGTGKKDRIELAVEAQSLEISIEQWFRIYVAALGKQLP